MVNRKILTHFRDVDPLLFSIATSIDLEEYPIERPQAYFDSLCRQIIGQQLSGKVADVIYDRFAALFPRRTVKVSSLNKISDEALRGTGMSWSKVRFIRDLGASVQAGRINLETLGALSDDEVIRTLTTIKGIGPWTAEMFLMFTLGRPDIFSFGDLGLKRAIQKLYKLKKEPSMTSLKRLTIKWKPYRTVAARLLWAYLDVRVQVNKMI